MSTLIDVLTERFSAFAAGIRSAAGLEYQAKYSPDDLWNDLDQAYGELDDEKSARVAGDTNLQNAIADERGARVAGDSNVTAYATKAANAAEANANSYTSAQVASERSSRVAGDNNLAESIANERSARSAGDTNTLSSARSYAESALTSYDRNVVAKLTARIIALESRAGSGL